MDRCQSPNLRDCLLTSILNICTTTKRLHVQSPMPPRLPMPLYTIYVIQHHVVPDISNIVDTLSHSFVIPVQASSRAVGHVLSTTADAQERPALTFTVVPGATSQAKPQLVSSHNHIYNHKRVLQSGHIHWQCSVCNISTYCQAICAKIIFFHWCQSMCTDKHLIKYRYPQTLQQPS